MYFRLYLNCKLTVENIYVLFGNNSMKKLIFRKFTKDIGLFFFILIVCVATIVWIIQAVNFLDLISEDGHSLKVYFAYTLFSLPKIISKILPFIFFTHLIKFIVFISCVFGCVIVFVLNFVKSRLNFEKSIIL